MAKRSKAKPESVLDIPVTFGGVSIGETTARLGMKIGKDHLNINAAEEALCGRRLTGIVQLGGNGDSAGQSKMFDSDTTINATFDVHRFGVGPDFYTTGLTFKLAEIDIGELAKFSKGGGRLMVSGIGHIPDDKKQEEPHDESDE